MASRSYSVRKAAQLLGVSVPTLKDMIDAEQLAGFQTPGGHLRVLADSLDRLQQGRPLRPAAQVSSVLQNRREHVEEMTLEAQELRAGREVRKLREEDAAERQQKQEERQQRAREAEQDAQRLELEQQQLEIKEREREQQARAQSALSHFRQRWLAHADKLLGPFTYIWLTPPQRKEVAEGLEAEIGKHGPDDEQRMQRIIEDALASLIAPLEAQRQIARRREQAVQHTMLSLSFRATVSERARAEALAREVLKQMPLDATPDELLLKAQDAIASIAHTVEDREARQKREANKREFIGNAFLAVALYKEQLWDKREISRQDYADPDVWEEINEDVRHQLSEELTGDEGPEEVEGLVQGMVDDAFDLESPDEDED